jgi:hypothetical protein
MNKSLEILLNGVAAAAFVKIADNVEKALKGDKDDKE